MWARTRGANEAGRHSSEQVLIRAPLALLAALVLGGAGSAASVVLAAGELSVARITADNAARLQRGGPDAIGGIDDWQLSNGTICAVISDVAHEGEFSASGGVLVDLGYCGSDDDHFSFSQDLLDGSRRRPIDVSSVTPFSGDDEVGLETRASRDGIELITRYRLDHDNPTQLKISKTLTLVDADQPGFNLFNSLTFNYHSLESFVYSSRQPSESVGFQHEDFVTRGTSAIRDAAHNADTIILLSPPEANPGVAYGWQLHSANRVTSSQTWPLPQYVLADEESVAMLVLADDFWIGDGDSIGLLQLPQIPLMGLAEGERIEIEERIYVGARGDVASVTDQLLGDAPTITGRALTLPAAVHIRDASGAPVSHVQLRDNGAFSLRATPGDYQLVMLGTAGRSLIKDFSVSADGTELGELALPPAARLALPRGNAMRLVFVGINGTQSPDFADRLTGFGVRGDDGITGQDEVNQVFLAGQSSDTVSVDLAPGDYRVWATRGPEYSVEMREISVAAGDNMLDIAAPERALETPGYIAADLHVHAGNSFDNTFDNRERVRAFVAEHGEVMVASEHDVAFDFAPLIREMGVDDKIVSVRGVEMTSLLPSDLMPYTGGHANFFPFNVKPLEYRGGMVNHESRRLREVIPAMRENNPAILAQLNHPRSDLSLSGDIPEDYAELIDDGAFLDHMGVAGHPHNPARPLHTDPNYSLIEPDPVTGLRDIDIDAMEIINPGGPTHFERIEAVRRDWTAFLLQGERITGTANSDSHKGSQQVAVPRNMVAVAGDSVSSFSVAELVAGLRSGNSYGTTGPMLEVDLSGVSMGDYFTGSRGILKVRISSADWIPVDRMTVQVNGKSVEQIALDGRRELAIELEFTRDAFVTVEVHGPVSDAYAEVYPGLAPYAYTNPIYVDHNRNGMWEPPGLDSDEQRNLSPLPIGDVTAATAKNTGGTTMPEHEKINYLEYQANDLEATKAFFSSVFGWQFVDYGPDYTAFSNEGVDGGFERADKRSLRAEGAALTIFFSDDLEATLAKVEAARGTIIEPIFSFPGGRRFHFTEPSGNEFAVWGNDPDAPAE